jgi:glycosyltransferase involved in cell wall biosynthesis
MKKNVLWISNIPTKDFNLFDGNLYNGLWIDVALNFYKKSEYYNTSVVTVGNTDKVIFRAFESIKYIFIPGNNSFHYKRNNKDSEKDWKNVFELTKPDLVVIWGSECEHSINAIKICNKLNIKYLLFVQGILHTLSPYFYGKLTFCDRLSNFSFRDIIKFDFFPFNYFKNKRAMNNELFILKYASGFIIENTWSMIEIKKLINNNSKFYFVNLPINPLFQKKTKIKEKFPVFNIISVSITNPAKGSHLLLKAAVYLIQNNMNFHISFTGKSPFSIPFFKRTWYHNYIVNYINKYKLKTFISFLGNKTQEELSQFYGNSNLFVSPSYAENHSSSVKEAISMNLPVITSNVGGIDNYFQEGIHGFFFDINKENDLGEKILSIIRNPRILYSNSNINIKSNSLESFSFEKFDNIIKTFLIK